MPDKSCCKLIKTIQIINNKDDESNAYYFQKLYFYPFSIDLQIVLVEVIHMLTYIFNYALTINFQICLKVTKILSQ